jgi:hypothetical protein
MTEAQELAEAIRSVEAGHCSRIAKPGHWVVYRDRDGRAVIRKTCE